MDATILQKHAYYALYSYVQGFVDGLRSDEEITPRRIACLVNAGRL